MNEIIIFGMVWLASIVGSGAIVWWFYE